MSKGDFGATSSSYGAVYHRSSSSREKGKIWFNKTFKISFALHRQHYHQNFMQINKESASSLFYFIPSFIRVFTFLFKLPVCYCSSI